MKVVRKTSTKKGISTSSMPDIIFMLLIFFMVTTVMREFEGLKVILPTAKNIEKLESKRHTTYIWASKDGLVNIDDRIIQGQGLRNIIYQKVSSDPKLTISLKSDEDAQMKVITDIHTEMRNAQALKLNYSALTKVN
tara:strand:+ start:4048 stop:4458 length:411 start_codon:yes stop_codon:yes gene_type:complete